MSLSKFRLKKRCPIQRNLSQQGSESNERLILLSGECNWQFRFKLVGLERLSRVFNEIIVGRVATDNGATNPRNVTLKEFKKKDISKAKDFTKVHNLVKYCRRYNRQGNEWESMDMKWIHSPFSNFSNNYQINMLYNRIPFGEVSFTPQFIDIECALYHGCELLTKSVSSRKVYYENNAKFDEWVYFEKLRYCQLPKNTRLSFTINMHTKEGKTLVIGSVSTNLFNEKGRLRTGINDLNIWPFYDIDSRLGCMKEYNGVDKTESKKI